MALIKRKSHGTHYPFLFVVIISYLIYTLINSYKPSIAIEPFYILIKKPQLIEKSQPQLCGCLKCRDICRFFLFNFFSANGTMPHFQQPHFRQPRPEPHFRKS